MKPKKTKKGALTLITRLKMKTRKIREKLDSWKAVVNYGKPKLDLRKWISSFLIAFGILLILAPLIITHINKKRNEDIIDDFLADAQRAMADSMTISSEVVIPVSCDNLESAEPDPDRYQTTSEPIMESSELDMTDDESSMTDGEFTRASDEAPLDIEDTSPSAPAPIKKPIMSAEEIQKRMTGVLIIEKIDLRMVIMDGVDEETLRVAAGRMPETGNFDEFGNVVLAGHRSYTLGKYFNRLDELEQGDEIMVQTKTKTLKYQVYKKHIIEPNDFSITNQSDSEKVLTLFTCHPVVIANQRLVVHAKQIN